MAIGVIFNFPGGTTEQYDQVCRGLNNGQPMRSLADWPGGGCLSHTDHHTEPSRSPRGELRCNSW